MFRIAVIGGGPAGLTAAIEAAKNGCEVTLFDKYEIGDNIRCAEGFFDSMDLLGEPKYGVRFKVDELLIQMNSAYTLDCRNSLKIWMIDRREWQRGLAGEAKALGVTVIEKCKIDKEALKKISSHYDWVIDASGVHSITSAANNFYIYYSKNSAATAQYQLKGDFKNLYGKIKVGFEKNYRGYYWIFPKSEYEANVGIGVFKKTGMNLWKELDRVIEKEEIVAERVVKRNGGLCPTRRLRKLIYGNTILVGDSAGLASPLHGGGIDTACISAKLAVQCLLQSKADTYGKELDRVIGKKLKTDKLLLVLWGMMGYKNLERVIRYVSRMPGSGMEYADLFNGNVSILKHVRHILFK